MSKKVIYLIIAVLLILGIGFYVYSNQASAPSNVENANTNTQALENDNSNLNANAQPANNAPVANTNANVSVNTPPANTHFSGEGDIQAPDIQVREVVYNGSTFSPASLTIKAGDIVVFKNESNTSFWPASDPHPTHTNYPGFDAGKAIAAGSTFEFKFTKVGTWGYHNHLNPAQHGTIKVQ